MSRATASAMLPIAGTSSRCAVKRFCGSGAVVFLALGSRESQPPLLSTAGFASASRFERHFRAANQHRGGAVPLLPAANRRPCLRLERGGRGAKWL